jgi:hypothetical protein
MPIRLNLLAEAQAAEEMRRKDPVKRAIWGGCLLIAVMLVWASSLQMRTMLARSELSKEQNALNTHTNEYARVQANQRKAGDVRLRLAALQQLSTNRFLNGTLLNALQQATVEDIQLTHIKAEQLYVFTEGTKSRTNDSNRVILGIPPTSTERIVVTLDGNDSSASPGDQVNHYKDIVAANNYFKTILTRSNTVSLKSLSPPQISPTSGKSCVMFTLECRLPEKTR